jgi:hypothetical protein
MIAVEYYNFLKFWLIFVLGHDLISFFVDFKASKPVLRVNNSVETVKMKASVRLYCSIEGNPRPLVFWQRSKGQNDELIANSTKFQILTYNE